MEWGRDENGLRGGPRLHVGLGARAAGEGECRDKAKDGDCCAGAVHSPPG